MEYQVNENGNNTKIKCHLLSDEEMRAYKFSDFREGWWSYWKTIDKQCAIEFMISINKSDPDDYRIDVLDDNFGQPYDYQHILLNNPDFKIALNIKEKVEFEMERLIDAGIVSGHEYGEYI